MTVIISAMNCNIYSNYVNIYLTFCHQIFIHFYFLLDVHSFTGGFCVKLARKSGILGHSPAGCGADRLDFRGTAPLVAGLRGAGCGAAGASSPTK